MATSTRILLGALVAALLAAVVAPAPASAHRNDESYLYLDVGDSTLSGRVELPYPDLREVFDFELAGSPDELIGELAARYDEMIAYLESTTAIGDGDGDWPLAFDGVELLIDEEVGSAGLGYAVFPFVVELDRPDVPRMLDVTFFPFLEEIGNRNNVALVSNDWQRGVIDEEANELLVLTASSPSGTIDLGDASQWKNFTSSIDLGVDHIRTGPDHIFFVLVLLLPSVLVLTAVTWRPSPSFGRSLGRVVIVATMFTIAHSITFTLAGLDILPLPPSKLVESLIALSIAAAALHNLRPVLGHREWAIAFAFGLFHGMGFAGLVADLDIDRTTQLVSLLGRNVGIEIGQIVVILVSFPLLFLLRRTRAYRPLFIVASVGLAVLSSLWVVERVGEVDLSINGLVDRALLWPRSLYVMIALTVLAAAYREYEARNDRLLPLPASEATDEPVDAEPEPELV